MTTTLFFQSDAYEIFFTTEAVETIVKYRRGLDGRGELIEDFDKLPIQLQQAIYSKLKQELSYAKHNHKDDTTQGTAV